MTSSQSDPAGIEEPTFCPKTEETSPLDTHLHVMGRLLHKLAMRAGTKVLSPIPELPEGSRSPTPVKCASNTSLKSPESPKLSEEECFLKHLQSIEAEYRQDMEKVRRELRVMLRTNARMEEDLQSYREQYGIYKQDWQYRQAKLLDLKMTLVKNQPRKMAIGKLHSLQDENKGLRRSHFKTVLENNSLRKLWMNMEGDDIEDEEFPDVEDIREAIVPRPPTAYDNGRAGSARRRPYTGKSRKDQFHLPPITENNKTVAPHKQTTDTSHEKKQIKSPVHLPQLVPTPPTGPRTNPPSRRQSRIPVALPPIRGATLVDGARFRRKGV